METMKNTIRTYLESSKGKKIDNDDVNLFDVGFVDSLFALQMVMFLEKEFSIKLKNKDISEANFSSVNNLAKLVKDVMDR